MNTLLWRLWVGIFSIPEWLDKRRENKDWRKTHKGAP